MSMGHRILLQSRKIGLERVPGDVAWMSILLEGKPFIAGYFAVFRHAILATALLRPTVEESARVAGIVEDPEGSMVRKVAPQQLATMRSASWAARPFDAILAHVFHGGSR
jgi:hypothetical protein